VNQEIAYAQVLDAADRLFYERGIQAVGMDEIRSASGVSLKRLYQCFPSKQALVDSYLRCRDERWRAGLAAYVAEHAVDDGILAVFDWLRTWLSSAIGARGCALVNSFAELGAVDPEVARAARDHKRAVLRYLTALAADAELTDPDALGEQLLLLVDGAIVTAAISGDPSAAVRARSAAATLLAAARSPGSHGLA
jgi:AcrR family transcriptional regulator